MCHEGMGHRQLRLVYRHFRERFWAPGTAKLIKRHILSCKVCQVFSGMKVSAQLCSGPRSPPGTKARASDVFTHWSVDFAGPFPQDAKSGCEYVMITVE